MNDYERVARVIRYLDAHFLEQPSLAALASEAGLSESHFHRLFSALVGVTPKDFVQGLTANYAKALLRRGESVLDAALDAGLSGPGRLHDLCLSLEAASPGEVKSGGRGLEITYGCAPSPFGLCLLAHTARGLCRLTFFDEGDQDPQLSLAADWPAAGLIRDDDLASEWLQEVFTPPSPEARRLRAWVRGSRFQFQVWRALLEIPPGSLATYGHLAAAIGNPGASRAVGTAVGANPLAVLIPCHRVIRETGMLGGYRWGPGRKRALLARELGVKACQDPAICGSVARES